MKLHHWLSIIMAVIPASAATVTLNCSPATAAFATDNSTPVQSVLCPAFNAAGLGASSLDGVQTLYLLASAFYQTPPATLSMTFTPSTLGGLVTWSSPFTALSITGDGAVGGRDSVTASAANLLTAFASSYAVGLSGTASSGTTGSTYYGAVAVQYTYTAAAPEPAMGWFVPAGLGLAFLARRISSGSFV
jgi:hypothetical protein